MKLSSLCLAASLVSACAGPTTESSDDSPELGAPLDHKIVMPTSRAILADAASPIRYHGGSVMTTAHNAVYLIWYGTWSSGAHTIIEDWANNVGGSAYFGINTTYHNRANVYVANAIRYGGAIADDYSQGKTIDDSGVETIVSNAITSGQLPGSSNGIYFVLAASDVTESSGMCSQYCGWHYYGSIGGKNIKYSYVGNPDQCSSSCAPQTTSPNGDAGADGAVSILSHELEETVTDPYISAWYDSSGQENGDKCAWTFGSEQTAANGSLYNVTIGQREYLVQQNWNAQTQSCGLSL